MQSVRLIVLTQDLATATRQVDELARRGLRALAYPCIATEVVPGAAELVQQHLQQMGPDHICFTSARAVDALQPLAGRLPLGIQVAAVGNATARRVGEVLGAKVNYVPQQQNAAELAALLAKQPIGSLLHVRGDRGGHVIAEVLKPLGWRVAEVVVYRHLPVEPAPLEVTGCAVVVLASESAARIFFSANREPNPQWEYLAIGPTTMQWLIKHGTQARMAENPEQLIETAVSIAQGVRD